MRVTSPTTGTSPGFAKSVRVRPDTYYVLSAWFRSQNVKPTIPPAVREVYHPRSPVEVQAEQVAQGRVSIASAHGYTDTAEWNKQFIGFKTGPDVDRVIIRGLINTGSGTAWFDDVSLAELFSRPSTSVGGNVVRSGRNFEHRANVPGTPLSFHATYRPRADHVRIDGAIRTSGQEDVPLQVSYTVPIDATGWRWGDDGRTSRRINRGTYANLSTSTLQQTSVYPFASISSRDSLIALGIPLAKPRMARIEYVSGRGLTVTFDLGVSRAARRLGPRADFSFVIYTGDPSWGFRAATQKYYELFPQSFVHRTDTSCEGTWFVAPPRGSIDESYRDFGLGFNMVALGKASSQSYSTWGVPFIKWDDDRGIYTTAYMHHWSFYQPIGKSLRSPTPPYDIAIQRLRALAASSPDDAAGIRLRDEARAALASTYRDFNGRLYYERYRKFLAHYQNVNLQPATTLDWARAVHRYQVERALREGMMSGGRLDGLHLDSTSGMRRWGAADDYDRTHWAATRVPLTFSYNSGLVVERGILSMYPHLADMADFAHRRGMFLSANFNSALDRTAGFVGADKIDYFGTEQGLLSRAKGRTADPFALLKRTLAHQRPLTTLDHLIGMGQRGPAEIDRQLQQSLFYGIFSGAWNPNIEADGKGTGTTWTRDELARLWAKYTPSFKRLARAGWEPMTYAESSDPDVWVERFGSPPGDELLFTVRNESTVVRPYRLTIDLAGLSPLRAQRASATEVLSGSRLQVVLNDGKNSAVLSDTIQPNTTRVFRIDLTP